MVAAPVVPSAMAAAVNPPRGFVLYTVKGGWRGPTANDDDDDDF